MGVLLAGTPGVIVGPIADFLGFIYNIIFNFIDGFISHGSLGVAIILFTILVKVVLLPLSYHQQKSSYKMQKFQPELMKIRQKYANKRDPESQRKMAVEMQDFQKKNGIGLAGGCLPLLIQLPILYALFYIFQQAYAYVDVIGQNYQAITDVIMSMPVDDRVSVFYDVAMAKKLTMDLAVPSDIMGLVNVITNQDWANILPQMGSFASQIEPLLVEKVNYEFFLGINLVAKPGFGFPGILIPILSAFTTYLQSKLMMKDQKNDPNNPMAASMGIMTYMMPIMMGFMTFSVPSGLGLYWTVSNIFMMLQQFGLTKYFKAKDRKESEGAA